ncbi:hypothetical protein OAT42_02050 [Alphaproteobacteria bacterium]|nr:hypothetical protein [Alphaproteobacteria bacterium]|tara:strand:+ start:785 stop:1468 length:684 start_codon:yes stop_codon:yes gene_type:complete
MRFPKINLKAISNIFLISSVPLVSWSSKKANNFKPKFLTLSYLCLGLLIFGLGESLLVVSAYGVAPWTVLAEGVAKKINVGIGLSTFLISVVVFALWIPLKLKPGIGTIMNILIIALTMGISIPLLSFLNNILNGLTLAILGTLFVGFGSGIYLIANLGPGTRDGLMTGLSKKYTKPISLVRLSIELSVIFLGWSLGGTLGIGTVIFAVFIGPSVVLSLRVISFLNK